MPFLKRNQPEKPGESPATHGGRLGSGNIGKSPFAQEAEHPGYKNPREAARGGTRRKVVRGRITDAAETVITRREKPLPGKDQHVQTAKEIRKARDAQLRQEEAEQAKQDKAAQAAAAKEAAKQQGRVNLAARQQERKDAEARRRQDRKNAAAQARRDAAQVRKDTAAAKRANRRSR
jgi:hypothetical protein